MPETMTLTFVLMDAPFESARTTTAMRLLDIAARRGYRLNVFAYEGAVSLPFARQAPHPNAAHGRDVHEENHPLPKDWVQALMEVAARSGGSLHWLNCGLCVDERGTGEVIAGVARGSPADLWQLAEQSDNTLVIATQ
jgi:tRNA 2-thiouridine synthesizing protein D